MPSLENDKVVSLSAFRKKAELSMPTPKDERVWDRVERLCHLSITQPSANTSKSSQLETWESAVNALKQYIDNEWPIEKENKVRANDIAEKAATLVVKGMLAFPQSQKSTELQTRIIDAFEEQGFPDALNNYRHQVGAMINTCYAEHSPA